MDNIKIIGTSHIAKSSIDEIKKAFEKHEPDIVCLELDEGRLGALIAKEKGHKGSTVPIKAIFRIGIQGYIFSLIGHWAEKKLGEKVGISPGEDMMTGFRLAKENKTKVALIDQNITKTLKRLSKSITWRERFRFIKDIFVAIFLGKKEFESIDLTKVPEKKVIEKLLKEVKKKYPNVYNVLVEERNKVLGDNIVKITELNPDSKILALIGAGHDKGVKKIVENKIKRQKNSK